MQPIGQLDRLNGFGYNIRPFFLFSFSCLLRSPELCQPIPRCLFFYFFLHLDSLGYALKLLLSLLLQWNSRQGKPLDWSLIAFRFAGGRHFHWGEASVALVTINVADGVHRAAHWAA